MPMPIPQQHKEQCQRVLNALRQLGERTDVIANNIHVMGHKGVPRHPHVEPVREFIEERIGLRIVILGLIERVRVYIGDDCLELTAEDGVYPGLFEYVRKFHAGEYPFLIADERTQMAVRADRCGL